MNFDVTGYTTNFCSIVSVLRSDKRNRNWLFGSKRSLAGSALATPRLPTAKALPSASL